LRSCILAYWVLSSWRKANPQIQDGKGRNLYKGKICCRVLNYLATNSSMQKRKRLSEAKQNLQNPPKLIPNSTSKVPVAEDTSRPTAVFKPTKGRDWTVSVALPGSIIAKLVLSIRIFEERANLLKCTKP